LLFIFIFENVKLFNFLSLIFKKKYVFFFEIYFVKMGIGDWGLGIGDWGLGPIPNPQSPSFISLNKIIL